MGAFAMKKASSSNVKTPKLLKIISLKKIFWLNECAKFAQKNKKKFYFARTS